MAPQFVAALGDGVFGGQEERLVIGGPFDRSHALGRVAAAVCPVRRSLTCSEYCRKPV